MEENSQPESLEDRIRKAVAENVAMQEFFKDYSPESVQKYVEQFVSLKSSWLNYGQFYAKNWESKEVFGIHQAREQLEIIQQKKLFDAQCLWRAGKAHFEQVEICFDFEVWATDVLNCPFIEPISKDDLRLYSQYLQSENARHDFWYYAPEWQDYKEFKDSAQMSDPDVPLPDWYEYADLYQGTGVLLSLPDLRGDREQFYFDLVYNKYKEENPEEIKKSEESFQRYMSQRLDYYDGPFNLDWFVRTFESKEDIRLYEAVKWSRDVSNKSDYYENSLGLLNEADEPVPIKANLDFREAIVEAANAYTSRKIVDAFPTVYEEYLFRIEMGLPFEETGNRSLMQSLRPSYAENIIAGRKLAGEPENLNYWDE